MGYMEVIKGMAGLTHYYPLNTEFQFNDQVGTVHGTNHGVTFTTSTINGTTVDAARFQGSQYFTLPDHDDFSINTTNYLHIHMHIIFDSFVGGTGPNNDAEHYHFMGKGATGATPVEWELRRYRQPNSGQGVTRPLRMSNYAFPSAGGSGAGDYIQPEPDGSEGGVWSNMTTAEATSMSTEGYEVVYSSLYTFDPNTGAGAGGPYPGYCQAGFRGKVHNYGSAANMSAYSVSPHGGTQQVMVGTSADGRGYLIGRIRRLAFFNRKLTTTELTTLANSQDLAETDSTPPSGNPGVDTFVEAFGSVDTAKYDVVNSAQAAVASNILKLTANTSGPSLTTKAVAPWALNLTGIYTGIVPAGGEAGTATKWTLVDSSNTANELGFKFVMESTGACTIHAGILASDAFTSEITTVPYSATTHKYFKIAQTNSTTVGFYYASRLPTSPSDNPWFLLGTRTLPSWTAATRIRFAQSSPSSVSTFSQFGNVNGATGTLTFTQPTLPTTPPTPGGPPLIDDFDDGLNTELWDANVGTPTVASSVLSLDATNTAEVLSSTTKVDLTGARELVEITQIPTLSTSYGRFRMTASTGNSLQWHFSANKAQAQQVVNGTTTNIGGAITFNATTTRIFSIREASGKVYFEYGPAASNLSPIEPAGRTNPIPVTSLTVVLEAQTP